MTEPLGTSNGVYHHCMKVPALLQYMQFLRQFQNVSRDVHINNRFENDVEHSFQLAMVAWWIVCEKRLPLNQELLLKYAMVHDLVEVFAGDTNPLTGSKDSLDAKQQKEREASVSIENLFPGFYELHRLIRQYAEKADPESKFIYVIDKILPIINEHISDSDWYKRNGITAEGYSAWLKSRLQKVDFDVSEVRELINDAVGFLISQGIFADRDIGLEFFDGFAKGQNGRGEIS